MNRNQCMQTSRTRLTECGTVRVRRLTLLFLLCLCAVTIPFDALTWALNMQLSRLSGLRAAAGRSRILFWEVVLSAAVSLAAALWQMGYQAFSLRVCRGEEVSFRTFPIPFRRFDQFLLLLLLQTVLIFLWSLLFMIPGIVAAYRYRLAAFILLDDPSRTASEAISLSRRMTYGHKLELFFLDLSFLWYTIPLSIFTGLTLLPLYFPALSSMGYQAALYAASIILPLIWQCAFMPRVSVTLACAYDQLRELDQRRAAALFGD